VGVDNINNYYDVNLKYGRLEQLGFAKSDLIQNGVITSKKHSNLKFALADLADKNFIDRFFEEERFDTVINLAAQAGVRYSLQNPHAYIDSNIVGFMNLLEACRHTQVGHLAYASSSSVYGLNSSIPFSVNDNVDHPISLYAASKKSNELMAHVYSHLFKIPTTGLRFFTVYGPWGRPDMALFIFTKSIIEGKPIEVFNFGEMLRDFTYIDDIVEGVIRVAENPAQSNPQWDSANPDPASSPAPYKIYNIGNSNPVKLMDFVMAIEKAIGKKAIIELKPIQPGDVSTTFADTTTLANDFGYKPNTSVETGIQKFINWYREYYKV
jgi:UDP-glucuronate 4-epimerase